MPTVHVDSDTISNKGEREAQRRNNTIRPMCHNTFKKKKKKPLF